MTSEMTVFLLWILADPPWHTDAVGGADHNTRAIPIRMNGSPWKEDCPAALTRNETLRATGHFGCAFWKRWPDIKSAIVPSQRCAATSPPASG